MDIAVIISLVVLKTTMYYNGGTYQDQNDDDRGTGRKKNQDS